MSELTELFDAVNGGERIAIDKLHWRSCTTSCICWPTGA